MAQLQRARAVAGPGAWVRQKIRMRQRTRPHRMWIMPDYRSASSARACASAWQVYMHKAPPSSFQSAPSLTLAPVSACRKAKMGTAAGR